MFLWRTAMSKFLKTSNVYQGWVQLVLGTESDRVRHFRWWGKPLSGGEVWAKAWICRGVSCRLSVSSRGSSSRGRTPRQESPGWDWPTGSQLTGSRKGWGSGRTRGQRAAWERSCRALRTRVRMMDFILSRTGNRGGGLSRAQHSLT